MIKFCLFPTQDQYGKHLEPFEPRRKGLIKTAQAYSPEVTAFIHDLKVDKNYLYALCNAVGAGEYYSSNVNGDHFPESGLSADDPNYGFKTFTIYGKPFKHHINKDLAFSYGEIPFSYYNHRMHRIELVIAYDRKKAPDIIERIESDNLPWVSIGTKVGFDECSICRQQSRRREDYCDHLKYRMNHIFPDGRKVMARNPFPRFFDISDVLAPAALEKTSILAKVASRKTFFIPSTLLAEKMGFADSIDTTDSSFGSGRIKTAGPVRRNSDHRSEEGMEKFNSIDRMFIEKGLPKLEKSEPTITKEELNKIASYPLRETFSTLALMGIVPKPEEFQRIVLVRQGQVYPDLGIGEKIAEQLDNNNQVFDDRYSTPADHPDLNIDYRKFNPEIFSLLQPYLEKRSAFRPFLQQRAINLIKQSGDISQQYPELGEKKKLLGIGTLPILALLGALYLGLRLKGVKTAIELEKVVKEKPIMFPLLASLGIGSVVGLKHLTAPRVQTLNQNILDRNIPPSIPYIQYGGPLPIVKTSSRLLDGLPTIYLAFAYRDKSNLGKFAEEIRNHPSYFKKATRHYGKDFAEGIKGLSKIASLQTLQGLSNKGDILAAGTIDLIISSRI